MSIRRRDNSVKPGCGIDGDAGSRFTKTGVTGPHGMEDTNSNHRERGCSRNSSGKAGDRWMERATEQPLRNVEDFNYAATQRDVYDDVVENDGGSANGGFSGPIKAGVNKSQYK